MKAQETVQSAKGSGSPHSREIQNEVGRIWSDVVRDKYLYVLALPGLIFYHFQIYSDYESRDCLPGVFSILWSARKPQDSSISLGSSPTMISGCRAKAIRWRSASELDFLFPAPIILALMLNEVRNSFYKRTIQSLVYIPIFILGIDLWPYVPHVLAIGGLV